MLNSIHNCIFSDLFPLLSYCRLLTLEFHRLGQKGIVKFLEKQENDKVTTAKENEGRKIGVVFCCAHAR